MQHGCIGLLIQFPIGTPTTKNAFATTWDVKLSGGLVVATEQCDVIRAALDDKAGVLALR